MYNHQSLTSICWSVTFSC